MTGADPILRVDGLRVAFRAADGVREALRDVSFSLARGEILGLVGESGAGKSLTGTAILGLLEPPATVEAGRILFEGRDLLTLPEHELVKVRGTGIGAIFQDPLTALDPLFSVGDQLVETLVTRRGLSPSRARADAQDLLASVGIPAPAERMRQYPHQFSGGMRQRVVIALTLACRPRVVIADEPTTALDVSVQAQIIDLLRVRAKAEDVAVILVSHDLGVIAGVADTVAVMYAGRIVEHGPVDRVLSRPLHPYTIGLIDALPRIGRRGRLAAIPGSIPRAGESPPGCAFAPRCPRARPVCGRDAPPESGIGGVLVRCHDLRDERAEQVAGRAHG